MSGKSKTFQERAGKAILEYAFLRWESAVLVSLTILLTTLSWYFKDTGMVPSWTWIACLLFGIVGEGLFVYTGLTDPETSRHVVDQLLHNEFHPQRLYDADLQREMDKAFDYRSRIEAAIHKGRDRALKKHLSEVAEQIGCWLKNIYNLAQRLDHYQEEKEIFTTDKARANKRIRQMQQQMSTETDAEVKQQLQVTIEGMRHQCETIDHLENTMEKAGLQLEHTLSTLGTIYSQTILIEAKDVDSSHERRMRGEITKEMEQLSDILAAMDAVYAADK